VRCVAFSSQGKLASAAEDQTVRVWDVETGQCVRFIRTFGGSSVAWAPDGNRFVFVSNNRHVNVAEMNRTDSHALNTYSPYTLTQIVFAPNGNTIAMSLRGVHNISVCDATRDQRIATFFGHTDVINCIAYSPCSNYLASASDDCSACIWHLPASLTGYTASKPMHRLQHQRGLLSLAFSPDTRHVVTATFDHNVYVWDVHCGICVKKYIGHEWSVAAVAFAPNNKSIASAGWDETVRLWPFVAYSWLCNMALILLSRNVAPYVVLDIIDMLVADKAQRLSFVEVATYDHFKRIKLIERVQRKLIKQ
jgi:WD40 repeat protein